MRNDRPALNRFAEFALRVLRRPDFGVNRGQIQPGARASLLRLFQPRHDFFRRNAPVAPVEQAFVVERFGMMRIELQRGGQGVEGVLRFAEVYERNRAIIQSVRAEFGGLRHGAGIRRAGHFGVHIGAALPEVEHGRRAFFGVFLQAITHHGGEAFRDVGGKAARIRRLHEQVAANQHARRLAVAAIIERAASAAEFKQDDAQRVHVRPRVNMLGVAPLFRRAVFRRPQIRAGDGHGLACAADAQTRDLIDGFGLFLMLDDAEIGQMQHAVAGEQHVARLHVSMRRDAAMMGIIQPVARLHDQIKNFLPIVAADVAALHPILQAAAVDIIHEHAGDPADFTDIPALNNVGVQAQIDPHLRLQHETRFERVACFPVRKRHFDGQIHVPFSMPDVKNNPHAAAPDDALDLVFSINDRADFPMKLLLQGVHFFAERGQFGRHVLFRRIIAFNERHLV